MDFHWYSNHFSTLFPRDPSIYIPPLDFVNIHILFFQYISNFASFVWKSCWPKVVLQHFLLSFIAYSLLIQKLTSRGYLLHKTASLVHTLSNQAIKQSSMFNPDVNVQGHRSSHTEILVSKPNWQTSEKCFIDHLASLRCHLL